MNKNDEREATLWLVSSLLATIFSIALSLGLVWWVWSCAAATTQAQGWWYELITRYE